MATEIVKNTALERRYVLRISFKLIIMVHVGLHEGDFAKPTAAHGVTGELQRRIAAVHIPNLERKVFRAAFLHKQAISLHILSARFVAVQGNPLVDKDGGGLHEIGIRGFDENDIDIFQSQRLFGRQNRKLSGRSRMVGKIRPGRALTIVNHADDLENLSHIAKRAKLAAGIADGPVTLAVKSQLRNGRPVVIAVSTNDALGVNAKSIGVLAARKNIYFVPFGQDDPGAKPCSAVADFSRTEEAVLAALASKQLQPHLI